MLKLKILNLEISGTCEECPYLNHDYNYSMSKDSGYDCDNEGDVGRIVDDYELSQWNKKHAEAEKSKETFFPFDFNEPHPLTIPNNCPLPDKIN